LHSDGVVLWVCFGFCGVVPCLLKKKTICGGHHEGGIGSRPKTTTKQKKKTINVVSLWMKWHHSGCSGGNN